jgi:carbon storage regulator
MCRAKRGVAVDPPIFLENGVNMLVLTRKCQEAVVVSGADGLKIMLKVTVLGIERGKVRLGFEAAANVPVHRLEVWERIRANAEIDTALGSDPPDWASNPP